MRGTENTNNQIDLTYALLTHNLKGFDICINIPFVYDIVNLNHGNNFFFTF